MTSPEIITFDTLLQATAQEAYQAAVAAPTPTSQSTAQLGDHFTVDSYSTAIEYAPVPLDTQDSGKHPVIILAYDGLGGLENLEYWSDDTADNDEVFTVYRGDDGTYKEDVVLSDDEFQAQKQVLRQHIGMHDLSPQEANELANYQLEKDLLQTGKELSPELMARLIPILKQARADLTYLT